MGLSEVDPVQRFKSHPWHGVFIGKDAPAVVTCFIEMVSTDTVKYEVDKLSGYLKIDRPQKYSNYIPALYGFIPQTCSGDCLARITMEKTGNRDIRGDGDPLDICILTEKEITHGDILVDARPVGGFRMLDGTEADDKIIAVLNNDAVYGGYHDISDCPDLVVERLKHYFLTYKDMPGSRRDREITHTYGKQEALEVITCAMNDYKAKFGNPDHPVTRY